jgi:monothiol glutaredoxin
MTDVRDRIEEVVKNNDVVLFAKGTPLFPQCGFTPAAPSRSSIISA